MSASATQAGHKKFPHRQLSTPSTSASDGVCWQRVTSVQSGHNRAMRQWHVRLLRQWFDWACVRENGGHFEYKLQRIKSWPLDLFAQHLYSAGRPSRWALVHNSSNFLEL